jgi:type I restriction enzyme M protein
MKQSYGALRALLAATDFEPSVVRRGLLELVAAITLRKREDVSLDEALELLAREVDIECLLLLPEHKGLRLELEKALPQFDLDPASPEQSLDFIDMLGVGDRDARRSSGLFHPPDWLVESLAALAIPDQPLLCLDCGDSTLVPRLLLRGSDDGQGQIEFTTVDGNPEIVSNLRLLLSLVVHDLEQVRDSVLLDEEGDRWRDWVDDSSPLLGTSGLGPGRREFGTILVNLLSPVYSRSRQRAELNELLPTFISEGLTSDGRAVLLAPSILLDGYSWRAFRESAQEQLHLEAIAEVSPDDELLAEARPVPLALITLRQPQQAITRSVTHFASSSSADTAVAPADLLDDLVLRLARREKGLPPEDREGILFERPTSELLADRWDAKFYSPARLALQDELINNPRAAWLGGITHLIRRGASRYAFKPYVTTRIAGVTFEGRQEGLARLKRGDKVWLRREPDNPYDPNAVHVERRSGRSLGYLPTELAEDLADALDDLGDRHPARVTEVRGGTDERPLGITIQFAPPEYAARGESVSVVRPKDITNNRLRGKGEHVWLLSEQRDKITRLQAGDLLLFLRGLGKACVVPREFEGALCHQDLAIVRPNEDIDSLYLLSFILSPPFQQQLEFVARGGALPMVRIEDLEELLVIVPPVRTQRRFALAFAESQGELGTRGKEGSSGWPRYEPSVDGVTTQQLISTSVLGRLFSDWDQIHTVADLLRLKGRVVRELRNLVAHGRSPFTDEALDVSLVALGDSIHSIERARREPEGLAAALPEVRRSIARFQDNVLNVQESFVRSRLSSLASRMMELLESESAPLPLQLSLEETVLPAGVPALIRLSVVNEGKEVLDELEIVPRFSTGQIVERPPWLLDMLGPGDAHVFEARVRFDSPQSARIACDVYYVQGDDRPVRRTIQLTLEAIPAEQAPFAPIHPNPYITGGAVDTPEMFFGRQDVLDFLKTNLIGRHQSNVIILQGNRRTGKTSILKQVVNRDLFAPHVPVFVDCQGLGRLTSQRFFYKLAREIWKALAKHHSIDTPPRVSRTDISTEDPFYDFQDVLDGLLVEIPDRRVVLLIDEFEVIDRTIQEGDLEPLVLENLRHLFQHRHDLAVVLTGSYRLTKLRQEYWSILFGLGLKHEIGFLDELSARQLITRPLADIVTFSDDAVDRIIELTACQPYFVQMVCHNVVNVINTRRTTYVAPSNVEVAAQETLTSADGHMRFMFESAGSPVKQAVLVYVASSLSQPGVLPLREIEEFVQGQSLSVSRAELQAMLREFADRDIVNIQGAMGERRYGFKIDLVRQWIRRNYDLRSAIALAQDASYIREG